MGIALYRKYRSKSLAEIIGQEHITQTLDHALKQGKISHAYLLTGPRGTGKTSIARILAHEINGLPYSEQPHLDIIEIDAASNRRIDEIRELKERVHTAPTSVKYKVYIIDEVHMLTKEAFNALLKTLEEPPQHVIFILATTESHKVPETIISRTQRFTFKPVPTDKVVAHLREIAKKESVIIDEQALVLIAQHGEGSFRDSISLLDQIRHTDAQISLKHVQQALGLAPEELLLQLAVNLRNGDLPQLSSSLEALLEQGIQPGQVARQLSQMIRTSILASSPLLPYSDSLQLLNSLLEISTAPNAGLKLELSLYSTALQFKAPIKDVEESKIPSQPHEIAAVTPKHTPKISAKVIAQIDELPAKVKPAENVIMPGALDAESWPKILTALKSKYNTLYGISRMAEPHFEPGKLTLNFDFAFHQKRLDDSKNKQLLAGIIHEVTGQKVSIICILNVSKRSKAITKKTTSPQQKPNSVDLEAISNIFGSAEVVE